MNRHLVVSATAALLLGSAALACEAPAQGPTLEVGDVINGNAAVIVTFQSVGAPTPRCTVNGFDRELLLGRGRPDGREISAAG